MNWFESILKDGRRWGLFMLIVASAGLFWTWQSAAPTSADAADIASPRPGFLAPDFTLETLDGREMTLSELKGQVVMINLWASWCPPCRAEMPAIEAIYNANKERGLEVLAVNTTYQDSLQGAAQFAQEYGLTFPILLDREGLVSRRYLLRALPTTFFVDRRGYIREVIPGGPMSESLIQSKIADLLEETP